MKRLSAATKAPLDGFSTTSKWTALIKKHTKSDIQAFVPTIRRSPLRVIKTHGFQLPKIDIVYTFSELGDNLDHEFLVEYMPTFC